MKLDLIEARFKEITGITQDLTQFPITDIVNQERRREFDSLGEVFTPCALIDKMILTSTPQPNKLTMDLCSGQGQFTVRILRYHTQNDPSFNVEEYLKNYHWFNELNLKNVEALLYIFGDFINITIGDARLLKTMPEENGLWPKGKWFLEGKIWKREPAKITQLF